MKSEYSILMVCEGTTTEMFYFDSLKAEVESRRAREKRSRVNINIHKQPEDHKHKPKSTSSADERLKSKRKKRNTRSITPEETVSPESHHKSQPTRYVRLAQLLALKAENVSAYNEIYAIYDQDRHADHKSAWDLAHGELELQPGDPQGPEVKIGLSCIAFEHWVLLHYEKNATAFEKAECKFEVPSAQKKKRQRGRNMKEVRCGSKEIQGGEDCQGKRCIGGYLRTNGLRDYKKSDGNLFGELRKRLENARVHAAWLRFRQSAALSVQMPYEVNPYTNLDQIVGHLLELNPREYFWGEWDQEIEMDNLFLTFSRPTATQVKVEIRNEGNDSRIMGDITLVTEKGTVYDLPHGAKLVRKEEPISFTLDLPDIPADEKATLRFNDRKTKPYNQLILNL